MSISFSTNALVGLRARWMLLARVAWFLVAALTLGVFAAATPGYFSQLHHLCTGSNCPTWAMQPPLPDALHRLGVSLDTYAIAAIALDGLLLLCFLGTGALLVRARPDAPVPLLAGFTLVCFGEFTSNSIRAFEAGGGVWALVAQSIGFLGPVLLLVLFCVFPDGRFIPGWTRWTAAVWVAGSVVASRLQVLGWLLALAMFATAAHAQVYRYRKVSTASQRLQTKWVVYGLGVAVVALAVVGSILIALDSNPRAASSIPGAVGILLLGFNVWRFTWALIPVSIAVAILRAGLFDIDLLINRTMVYGGLTVSVVGLYILLVVGANALLRTGDNLLLSLVATGIVAVLFQPLRERVQRGVNRLLYGERDDPYAIISRLGKRLEESLEPGTILPTVVETVREALKLRYAAIALRDEDDFSVAAASGTPVPDVVTLLLVYQSDVIGQLLLGARGPGEEFGSTDMRLLRDLARHAGAAAHTVKLTTDLQRSRERLVATREEERRRLRRDLHDGLGPMLGSVTLKLDIARSVMQSDPATAERLIGELKNQTQTAIADIRRLVYGLRPPVLDDLGLAAALRQSLVVSDTFGSDRVVLDVEMSEPLPALPAAVEVAAFRIAQEATTNVLRHAGAHHCVVRLSIDEAVEMLDLEIRDDGHGLPPTARAGVGVRSMKERATELGGSCTVESGSQGGTRVRAILPYGRVRVTSELAQR